MLVGHLNLAACHLRLNNNFKCMKECEKVGCPEIHNLMRCRQGKRGFLELSLSIYASWFRYWIDSIQTQICFQLSLLSAWKQIVIFGRKREATREFFRQEETTAWNMFVFAGYHRGRWLSHHVRVLYFFGCCILLAKYVSPVCWFSTLLWEVLSPVTTVGFIFSLSKNQHFETYDVIMNFFYDYWW